MSQICKTCKVKKDLDCYQHRNGRPYQECKECIKKRHDKNKPDIVLFGKTKKCTKCNEEKDYAYFYSRNGKPVARCKKCENEQKMLYKRKARQKARERKIASGKIKVATNANNMVCRECDRELHKSNFRHNRRKCTDCERKHGREYRRGDVGKNKAKKWAEENPERMTELQADWYQNNKEDINKKNVDRYQNDPIYKLTKKHHQLLQNAIKSNGGDKIIKHVKCSRTEFKTWTGYCFDDNMDFDNYGKDWHIDHVIPIKQFDLTDKKQIKLCFNWRNTMPITAKKNMNKKANVDLEQIKKHYKSLKKFHKENDMKFPKKFKKMFKQHLE